MSLPAELAIEELARRLRASAPDQQNEDLLQSILLELEVRQFELELRNHELWRERERLRASRDRYADLYDQAPVPCFAFDAQGVIREVNRTGAAFLGVERAGLLGQPFAVWLEPGSRAAFQAYWESESTAPGAAPLALRACIPGRGAVEVELRGRVVVEEGVDRRLAVLVEVNGQTKNAAPIDALPPNEGLQRAQTAFLTNMSHEIRTPVGAILGITDFLLDEREIPIDKRRHWARRLRYNGEWLLRVIDDVLDLAHIESGRVNIVNQPVDLPTLVDEAVESFRAQAESKGLRLQATIERAAMPLLSDGARVRHILNKLLDNALKFTDAGEVSVAAGTGAAGQGVELRVRDTGVGMAREAQSRLFHAFFQEDDSLSRRFGGAGLGLALAKRWALLLGGDVRLESSSPGRGSEFVLQLPRQPPALTPALPERAFPREASLGGGELKGLRILLVEDVPDNQLLLRIYLEQAGASVDIASEGGEGVCKALSADYDLVLMDIQMSGVDGIEATRRLRGVGYDRPIIALTAHALNEEREKSLSAGCDDHLTKPIQPVQLVRCIRSRLAY